MSAAEKILAEMLAMFDEDDIARCYGGGAWCNPEFEKLMELARKLLNDMPLKEADV